MEIWILIGCVLSIILAIVWFLLFTPYPFVILLRRQKDEIREKGPAGIEQLRNSLTIQKDVMYPSKYPKATYDLYVDETQEVKRLLIWVHGGSFIGGTSAGAKNFACLHASQGTCVCAINYALAPEYTFPKQTLQLDEFLCYAYQEVIPKFIHHDIPCYIGGDSAGANIVAMYACFRSNDVLAKQLQIHTQSKKMIQGLLLCCGPYDFCEDLSKPEWNEFRKFFKYLGWSYLGKRKWWNTELPKLASPMHHITSAYPPSYICDGKKYSFLWQGIKFSNILKENQVVVQTRFYEEMPHEFQFDYQKYPIEATQVFQDSIDFIKDIEQKGNENVKE